MAEIINFIDGGGNVLVAADSNIGLLYDENCALFFIKMASIIV